ncbi:hypothetical protein LSH36_341g04008 [Paralvinella palmiformis]|uniref:Uncharacterized protein n=1 Tax=Paralvinella palmiformis TaxID=53620 RepID=A0AAD9MZY9_9ANNE|nr:hypothetical protein LSH36_341g04008 [Paralvinella palmiformis]
MARPTRSRRFTVGSRYAARFAFRRLPAFCLSLSLGRKDDFDNLRPLCYPGTDVFLLCFSVVNPTSFHNVREKWVPELRKKFPKVPMILVGTLCDLRADVRELIQLDKYNERPVGEAEAEQAAREIGAVRYVECSALTQKNMKEVFDAAIFCALERRGLLAKAHGRGFGSRRWKRSKNGGHTVELVVERDSTPRGQGTNGGLAVREKKPQKSGWKKFCCFL